MSGLDPAGLLEAVADRERLLGAVGTEGISKADLVDRLEVSRTTVDRALGDLVEADLVEHAADGYRRTLVGELALAAYRTYSDEIEGIGRADDVLSVLPADVDVDPCLFANAAVHRRSTDGEWFRERLRDRILGVLDGATRVDVFSPLIDPARLEAYRARLAEGSTVRMLLTDGAVRRTVARYSDGLAELLSRDRFALRQTDSLPYALIVAEAEDGPRTCLVTHENGGVHGLVENDTPAAVEWAREQFDRRWERGTPLPAPAVEDSHEEP